MKYKFYNKNDEKKDALGFVEASNQTEAEELSAGVKQLTLIKFKELFSVTLIDSWGDEAMAAVRRSIPNLR